MVKEKNDIVMLDHTQTKDSEMLKNVPIVEKTDYSGAHEKTDPREIALVKKLDRWIMPMLWSMYWLVCDAYIRLGPARNTDFAIELP
jgi:hypothetical protein